MSTLRSLTLALLVSSMSLLGLACDAPTSSPSTSKKSAAEPSTGSQEPQDPTTEVPAAIEPETERPPEAPTDDEPTGGPRCDQRELIDEGGAAKRLCVDYSEHRGASEPRCFEGVPLSEGPCPREGLAASCVLEATGVELRYYEGANLQLARERCRIIEGRFDPASRDH